MGHREQHRVWGALEGQARSALRALQETGERAGTPGLYWAAGAGGIQLVYWRAGVGVVSGSAMEGLSVCLVCTGAPRQAQSQSMKETNPASGNE